MLRKVLDFTDEVLSGPVDIKDWNLTEQWHHVVLFHLSASFNGLRAVKLVSASELFEPAVVLTRYLFELGVNLRYLDIDPTGRVPDYLKHSGILSTSKEFETKSLELKLLREEMDLVGISKLLLPPQSWKRLNKMCLELECMDHYSTFYRTASQVAHGGAHSLPQTMLGLLGYQGRTGFELPGALLTALIYFRWVADISSKIFPVLESRFPFGSNWNSAIEAIGEEVLKQAKRAADVNADGEMTRYRRW